MQNSPGGNGVRKLGWLASAVAAALLGAGGEAEAGGYVDGAIDETLTNCSTGDFAMGIGGRTGYYVDPVLQTPKLGQVVYIHAAATNLNPCDVAGTTIGFDFFLPPGAVTAVSAGTPVKCYIGNGTTGAEVTEHCLQTPEVGVYGGLFFGYESKIARGWSFEIQVPVIFNQSLAGQTIDVYASSSFGTAVSSVAVTVPYAAAAPPPPPQPTPSPFAIGNDIALLGSAATGSTLPVAFSNDDGSFTVTSRDVGDFAVWARTPNVQRLSGDFNGDGLTDFALVGGAGWNTIPVALSLGDGRFTITNNDAGWFGAWASTPNVKALTGDFNHDGHTDIALVGGANWSAIPIAFAAGNGTWTITNNQSPDFAWWAGRPNVRALTGDFNKDGFTDIALTGAAGWLTVPVAFSYGNGNFLVTNRTVCIPLITFPNGSWIPGPNFATLASAPGAQVVTGDFNKDGYADLALAGGAGWDTIPMAFSYGDGTFAMYAKPSVNFPVWATTPGATLLTGDFNGDGYTDLALTGAAGWNTVPLAINIGFGSFAIINSAVGAFGSQSATAGARAVTGDFNGDGHTDIALTGGAGFSSIPVAFSAGIGAFNVTNQAVTSFGAWSSDSAATTLAGRVN